MFSFPSGEMRDVCNQRDKMTRLLFPPFLLLLSPKGHRQGEINPNAHGSYALPGPTRSHSVTEESSKWQVNQFKNAPRDFTMRCHVRTPSSWLSVPLILVATRKISIFHQKSPQSVYRIIKIAQLSRKSIGKAGICFSCIEYGWKYFSLSFSFFS